jgi:PEP-CTERM motif
VLKYAYKGQLPEGQVKRFALALLPLAAVLAAVPVARADSFTFTYSAPGGVSGSGTLYGSPLGSGEWAITSATGTFNDGTTSGAISLIPDPSSPTPVLSPSGYFTYDDLLFPFAGANENVDYDGLLFDFGGIELNFWEDGAFFPGEWAENNGNGGPGTFDITGATLSASETPEPNTLLLLGTGLLCLGVVVLRQRAKLSGVNV